MRTELTLPAPSGFRFLSTVNSHGWCVLAPFSYDEAAQTLATIYRLRGGDVVRLDVRAGNGDVRIGVDGLTGAPQPETAAELGAVVGRVLGFGQDVRAFYQIAASVPGYDWIEPIGAGRMLVSPTVWEDLAKTLLTTNTTWSMTKLMVSRLAALGEPFGGGGHVPGVGRAARSQPEGPPHSGDHAFPTPERIAALAPDALNAHVRAGYRGAYLHALALAIAEGHLDPDSLRDPGHSDADVYKRLKSIKGFGDYAAGAMSRLLGRFDALGLDSVCRAMCKARFNGGAPASDAEIAAHYAPFGPWRGLAVWMDVMREDLLPASGTPGDWITG